MRNRGVRSSSEAAASYVLNWLGWGGWGDRVGAWIDMDIGYIQLGCTSPPYYIINRIVSLYYITMAAPPLPPLSFPPPLTQLPPPIPLNPLPYPSLP